MISLGPRESNLWHGEGISRGSLHIPKYVYLQGKNQKMYSCFRYLIIEKRSLIKTAKAHFGELIKIILVGS